MTNVPTFMMNIPSSYDTAVRNNVWMEEYDDEDIIVNKPKAIREMWEVYSFLPPKALYIYCLHPLTVNCRIWFLWRITESYSSIRPYILGLISKQPTV